MTGAVEEAYSGRVIIRAFNRERASSGEIHGLADKLAGAKEDLAILHPLPRVNEIDTAIDSDKRACYFRQALYGKFVRMALILMLLEEAGK